MADTQLIMDYWKLLPGKILLSEKIGEMTTQQFGGYWLITCRLYVETPIYGVTNFDEAKLTKWSKLSDRLWIKERGMILSPFLYHPATRTLHHEFIKGLFYDFVNGKHLARAYGQRGGNKTNGKKMPKIDAPTPPAPSPYAPYKPPFIALFPVKSVDLSALFEHAKSTPPAPTLLSGCSNIVSNEVTYSTQQLASPGAAAAGRGDEGEGGPIKLGSFLKQSLSTKKEAGAV